MLLADAAVGLRSFGDSTEAVVLELLDRLLLVFIVVELLFAVRITIAKREIVAEPFLIVGMIASVKEILVLAVKAADAVGGQQGPPGTFRDSVTEIGVLGALVLLIAAASWLMRRKEREPDEGQRQPAVADRQAPADSG